MQPVPKSTFFLIYLMVFINIMAFSLVFPLAPFYAKLYSAGDATIGLLGASFAFAQLIFSPLWGSLSDKFGRKPIMAVGLLGAAASFLLFALAGSLSTLFISRILQGICSGAIIPVARAFIADITTAEERVREMGRIGAALASGLIFGPVIGGIFAEIHLALPFLGAAAVAFLCFVFVLFTLPESVGVKTKNHIAIKKELVAPFLRIHDGLAGKLMPLFLLSFLWSFGLSAYQVAAPLLGIEKFKISTSDIGVIFTILGIVTAVIQFFLLSKITTMLGEKQSILLGLVVMALGLAIMPFLPIQLFLLYLLSGVFALGSAISRPVITALLSKETSEGQGVTMGTSGSFESLGHFVGPLAAGFLFGLSPATPFLFSTALMLGLLVFIVLQFQFANKQKQPYRL